MKKILVIHDEDRHIEEGRRKAAAFVARALSREFRVIRKPFGPELPQQIREADGVFSVAIGGRSDNLQAHLAGIIDAYGGTRIGPSAFAHALCLNKAMTKAVLGAAGIRVPRGILFQGRMLRECPSSLEPPFFVKPSREGSGIGVEPSSLQQDWQGAMEVARKQWHRFRQPILIEEYVSGRELTVGVLQRRGSVEMLPPLEVDFSALPEEVEHYQSRRVKEDPRFLDRLIFRCPPRLSKKTREELEKTLCRAFHILQLEGFVRMEVRLPQEGPPVLIEVNSAPGLDPEHSDFPRLVAMSGMNMEEIIRDVTREALHHRELLSKAPPDLEETVSF